MSARAKWSFCLFLGLATWGLSFTGSTPTPRRTRPPAPETQGSPRRVPSGALNPHHRPTPAFRANRQPERLQQASFAGNGAAPIPIPSTNTRSEISETVTQTEPNDGDSPSAEQLRERWQREEPDAAWTTSMQQSLRDLTETAGIDGSVVHSVSCRTSLCRVVFEFPDLSGAAALSELTREQAAGYSIVSGFDAAGGVDDEATTDPATHRYDVYISREKMAKLNARSSDAL